MSEVELFLDSVTSADGYIHVKPQNIAMALLYAFQWPQIYSFRDALSLRELLIKREFVTDIFRCRKSNLFIKFEQNNLYTHFLIPLQQIAITEEILPIYQNLPLLPAASKGRKINWKGIFYSQATSPLNLFIVTLFTSAIIAAVLGNFIDRRLLYIVLAAFLGPFLFVPGLFSIALSRTIVNNFGPRFSVPNIYVRDSVLTLLISLVVSLIFTFSIYTVLKEEPCGVRTIASAVTNPDHFKNFCKN